MRKIGLLSDTHGYLPSQLMEFFKDCDEIWHAGDWGDWSTYQTLKEFKPLVTVWGNIDAKELRVEMPEYIIFEREKVKVLLIHIGGYPGKYSAKCHELIKSHRPDVMVCGHSHILKVVSDKTYGLLHLNPGAAGYKGFHTLATAIRFEINEEKLARLEVWEIPKRHLILEEDTV